MVYKLSKGAECEAWGEKRREAVCVTEQEEEGKTRMKDSHKSCDYVALQPWLYMPGI